MTARQRCGAEMVSPCRRAWISRCDACGAGADLCCRHRRTRKIIRPRPPSGTRPPRKPVRPARCTISRALMPAALAFPATWTKHITGRSSRFVTIPQTTLQCGAASHPHGGRSALDARLPASTKQHTADQVRAFTPHQRSIPPPLPKPESWAGLIAPRAGSGRGYVFDTLRITVTGAIMRRAAWPRAISTLLCTKAGPRSCKRGTPR